MDDFEKDANFIGVRAAISFAGLMGFFVIDKSYWWLLLTFLTAYGFASLLWYLKVLMSDTAKLTDEKEPERDSPETGTANGRVIVVNSTSARMPDMAKEGVDEEDVLIQMVREPVRQPRPYPAVHDPGA